MNVGVLYYFSIVLFQRLYWYQESNFQLFTTSTAVRSSTRTSVRVTLYIYEYIYIYILYLVLLYIVLHYMRIYIYIYDQSIYSTLTWIYERLEVGRVGCITNIPGIRSICTCVGLSCDYWKNLSKLSSNFSKNEAWWKNLKKFQYLKNIWGFAILNFEVGYQGYPYVNVQ